MMFKGGKNLEVHCRSGDDDLGTKTLPPGASMQLRFDPNILGTTLFYCGLWSEDILHNSFVAYDYTADYSRCSHCRWIIEAKRACLYCGDVAITPMSCTEFRSP
ncbi:hypothetical protein MLD38_018544 [Melastoma candidum]|uniref:Uncharacterized protein n=1 Tax=Melastoma candidum TaxID=119954 RepID=A0ACB9QU15_9MYRT|nr:hypothetical protein MLD38_018544 [Melastoma candidum]